MTSHIIMEHVTYMENNPVMFETTNQKFIDIHIPSSSP